MSSEKTGTDAIQTYNTGAGSHDAAQNDPTLSLGGFKSSTPLTSVKPTLVSPSLGSCQITIERIEANNPLGVGVLTAVSVNSVTWQAPGGAAGPAVTILNGETRQLLDGNDPDMAIVITRDEATDMTSSTNVTIVQETNNAFFSDVADAERVAGSVKHRAHAIKNESGATINSVNVRLITLGTKRTTNIGQLGASGSGTISSAAGNFADWPNEGYALIKESDGTVREWVYYESRDDDNLTVAASGRGLGETTAAAGAADDTIDSIPGFELSVEAPASQPSGTFNTVADEDAAPAGATWTLPVTDAEAKTIGNLGTGEIYCVRLRREIAAGSTNVQDESLPYEVRFEAV